MKPQTAQPLPERLANNGGHLYDQNGNALTRDAFYSDAVAEECRRRYNAHEKIKESMCNAHLHIHNQRTGYGNTEFLDLAEKHIKLALAALEETK